MSIAKALSNAVTGLTATARGTETIASNIANAMTPDYARREIAVSAQTLGGNGGGVRIDGITRIVNASILAETRLAEAARSEAQVRLDFLSSVEAAIGAAGSTGSLGSMLTDFHTSLEGAAARPDDETRLSQVVTTAERLAKGLNKASEHVQNARSEADRAIATDVSALNVGLERVAYLNRKIATLEAQGGDSSSLQDERQAEITKIATIIPVQEISREGGKIALFTSEGAVLLDGSKPTELSFTAAGQFTPDMQVGTGPVMRLVQNGVELTASQMGLFAGGSLAANFAIRDELAPQVQQELDALAFDLHERLADPSVDPTISGAGFFTDAGGSASVAGIAGLSARLKLNESLRDDSNGPFWRVRAGVGATAAVAVGDSAFLTALSGALDAVIPAGGAAGFEGNASIASRLAQVEARLATRRVNVEADVSIRNSRADTMASRLMTDGVDTDAEMRQLLQYEQAYAANARVIQAIDEMMNQLLRL